MNDNLPKVLVISVNAWQDNNPTNHIFSDIFSCWDKDKVANIYVRAGVPSTTSCDRFLKINENSVIKSLFRRKIKTAKVVENCYGELDEQEKKEFEEENKRYSKKGKKHSCISAIARDIVWFFGKWKTAELTNFIDEFDPDVIFLPMYSVTYMTRMQSFIAEYAKKPVVCYMTDDNYSYLSCDKSILGYIHRFFVRKSIRALMKNCNLLFGMTPKAHTEYGKIFGVKSDVLTKAVDFSKLSFEQSKVHSPVRVVYAGRLVIGRDKAIVRIADAVKAINKDKQKIQFDIYSSDVPSEAILKGLSTGGVRFMGEMGREKIFDVQKNADIAVFAEPLDKKYRNIARMSFSTKLTDYLASGKCIFALGSEDIAPMDYLKREDAAVIVTDYGDIEGALRRLCDSPELISEYGKKAYECGKRNHSADKVYKGFIESMCKVADTDR